MNATATDRGAAHMQTMPDGSELEHAARRARGRWLVRPTPTNEPRPRRRVYPMLGAALAFAIVGGMVAVSLLSGDPQSHATIAYLLPTLLLTLTVIGHVLGRREDELRAQALTDPLTGLANRRYLDERIAAECHRVARYGTPLSLLLIDLDRLKSINDTRGHAAGDAALRTVARSVSKTARAYDVVARYGGDELAVLLPRTRAHDAAAVAERIHEAIAAESDPEAPVTVSIGVADSEIAGEASRSALFRVADEALYAEKAVRHELDGLTPPYGVTVLGNHGRSS